MPACWSLSRISCFFSIYAKHVLSALRYARFLHCASLAVASFLSVSHPAFRSWLFLALLSSASTVSLLPALFWLQRRVGFALRVCCSHRIDGVAELPLYVVLLRVQSVLRAVGGAPQRVPQRQSDFPCSRWNEREAKGILCEDEVNLGVVCLIVCLFFSKVELSGVLNQIVLGL